jgi:hypothetical protein
VVAESSASPCWSPAGVAGYSRLMGADEEALARLKAHNCVLVDPKVAEHKG